MNVPDCPTSVEADPFRLRLGSLLPAIEGWGPINKTHLTLRSASASFAPMILQGGLVMEKLQRRFGAGIGVWFRAAVAEEGRTRGSLARGLCEVADWRNAKGEFCLASARRALPGLAADLGVRLPEARPAPLSARRVPSDPVPDPRIEAPLGALGAVRLEPADGAADVRAWRSMMALRHPQGAPLSPGARLRYWIVSERRGRLGGVGFKAAGWHSKARDAFIGWSPRARAANLGRLVENDRFLILPGVRVRNLASRVLALAAERLPGDWEAAHGVRPLAACTHTGPGHSGACYRAAGWSLAGRTSGRRGPKRRIWVRPLAGDWREELGRAPAKAIGWAPEPALADGAGWAEREYARSAHPDPRIRDRIAMMGEAWENEAGRSLPEMFPGEAERKAAYRLLSNPEVGMDDILEPHLEATAERGRREPVVLAIQDTTTLNYNGLGSAEGLADLGGGGSGTKGLAAHFCLAAGEDGRPLGVVSIDADFRGGDRPPESGRWLEGFDKADELARACPGARTVVVCDREGDIWELLRKAEGGGTELLVRACRSKRRRVRRPDGGAEDLHGFMAAQPVLDKAAVAVEACGGPRARTGRRLKLELRAARVALVPPEGRAGEPDLGMLAVSAVEADPPAGTEPAAWLLLASAGEACAEDARAAVRRYRKRWTIEEFFRVLKSGLRVEERRFDHAEDLRKCLAFDAATACRVFDIARAAKETPDAPAVDTVPEDAPRILKRALRSRGVRPKAPPDPTIREFTVELGRIAGFQPSKRQPLPGIQKLWSAWTIFAPMMQLSRDYRKYGLEDESCVGN